MKKPEALELGDKKFGGLSRLRRHCQLTGASPRQSSHHSDLLAAFIIIHFKFKFE